MVISLQEGNLVFYLDRQVLPPQSLLIKEEYEKWDGNVSLVFDCAHAEYICDLGLFFILKMLVKHRNKVYFINVSDTLQKMLNFMGLDEVFFGPPQGYYDLDDILDNSGVSLDDILEEFTKGSLDDLIDNTALFIAPCSVAFQNLMLSAA